ncbi:hypothetical protein CesoFtcFv8_017359 [Champsocephalus esox]|uniref:Myb-like domain-containing protein n=1 Tax=Champsocephalus esox TaxID=159716 RepID=A0AAN8GQ66_9TELE|nr:hypothetical protein CesoFtcFv8_017359 [Champsocephalus esox]
MASYEQISKHTNPKFESPARVFAKLKSKVREENRSANQWNFPGKEPLFGIREKHGGVFKSPRKRSESTWMTDQFKENKRSSSYRDDAQALTLSPISSPQKGFGCWFSDISSERVEEVPLGGHGCTPRKRAFLESTALSIRPPIHTEPAQIRDSAGFHGFSRTSVKRQPLEHDFVNSVFGEGYPPVDKRMPPPVMLSPTRNRLRKRTWEPQEFDKVSSCRKVSNEGHPQPERTTSSALKCFVAVKRCPPMSPAKMFATMKKRESKIEQQEVNKVSNCTRDLFVQAHNKGEVEDNVLRDFPDSQSETDPSENVDNPVLSPQPFLHEDPLVLNSPRVSIPKKEAVFKRNNWRQRTQFPCESVIHLKKWFLNRDRNGLFLGGTHRDANVLWNSSILVERVSNTVVKSASGSVYILIGKMYMNADTEFPKWFLKKFATGFPPNWEALYEKLLSESRDAPSRGTDRNRERRSVLSKTNPDASTINSVKRQKQKLLKTPDSSPSAPLTQAKVSRSGRVLKAPLEYWKGGRVFMDAHMNVTIHACYETSICMNDTTTVSTKTSQKPARSEGRKQREPVNNKEASVPLRRVKAPPRRDTRAKVKPASSQDEVNERKKMGTVQRKSSRRVPKKARRRQWTEAELMKLQKAVSYFPKDMSGYWEKVARMVGTRSAEECYCQHTWQGTSQTPEKTARKKTEGKKKAKVKATEDPVTDPPLISAGLGTFKRKQQVREFLEAMPREDVEDAFSSEYMQRKRFEVPSMCQSEEDFNLSEMEPLSPTSTVFPEVKTPQGLHITPGMIGSLNRTNNEKYIHKLQKKMKMNQFQVCKQAPSSKTFTPTPSVKQAMRRCANTENDSFVVWEMFPEKDAVLSESGEEEDFYFSDNA